MTLIKFNHLVTQKLVASTLSIKIFLFELILYTSYTRYENIKYGNCEILCLIKFILLLFLRSNNFNSSKKIICFKDDNSIINNNNNNRIICFDV